MIKAARNATAPGGGARAARLLPGIDRRFINGADIRRQEDSNEIACTRLLHAGDSIGR